MTKAATVVRYNKTLAEAYDTVLELEGRLKRCSLSDTGNWTNQNVVFTKSLIDMFPLAKTILLRGAWPATNAAAPITSPSSKCRASTAPIRPSIASLAEVWCDRFEANTRKWLKSTIAVLDRDGEPQLSYEEVDTSLLPPRPRMYGLVGAELIEQVWKERQAARHAPSADSNGVRHQREIRLRQSQ